MPIPREEAARIGTHLSREEAIDRIRTGNHKHGGEGDRWEDTDIMLITMLTDKKIEAWLLPDGELCFYPTDPQTGLPVPPEAL